MKREEIIIYNDLYLKIKESISKLLKKYTHDEEIYKHISSIVNYIKNCSESFQQQSIDEAILLIGTSGSGKSTLLNYLVLSDEELKVGRRENLELIEGAQGVEIGCGKGSTTLIPNFKVTEFGNFLDLAGNSDSGGEIVDLINYIIKTKIVIKRVKILIICLQDSLDQIGTYGEGLKNCLSTNHNLFENVGNIENVVGLIFTKTSRTEDTLQDCKESLGNLLNHSFDTKSKDIIKNLLGGNNLSTFAKPSADYKNYVPPNSNKNQRENIKNMINGLSYTQVPNGLFGLSSHSNFIDLSFQVVRKKIQNQIHSIFTSSLPIKIMSVEMEQFSNLLKYLCSGSKTNLNQFLNLFDLVLGSTNQLQKMDKFNEEILFLSNLIGGDLLLLNDWVEISDIKNDLHNIFIKISETLSKEGNNFSKSLNNDKINISCKTIDVKSHFDDIFNLYKKINEIKLLKENQNSIYYKDEAIKVFVEDREEDYFEDQIVDDIKMKKVKKPVKKFKVVKEIKDVPKTVTKIEKKLVPHSFEDTRSVTTYEERIETIVEEAPVRTWTTGILTLGFIETKAKAANNSWKFHDEKIIKKQVPVVKQEKFINTKEILTDIAVTEYIIVPEEVEIIIEEDVFTDDEEPEITKKTIKVPRKRIVSIYKDESKKVFDEILYNNDLNEIQNKINKTSDHIRKNLGSYCKSGITLSDSNDPISANDIEKNYLDLISLWRNTEYSIFKSSSTSRKYLQ